MTHRLHDDSSLAQRLSLALASRNLDALGALFSDDVTWGDVTHPRGCRNRTDVLATFSRLLDFGVSGNITELATGSRGILVGLEVTWPEDSPRESDTSLFQVYLVRDDKIVEIRRFDDRTSAARVAGLRA
jgi:ketosteroid isomerase-like protein